MNDQIRIVKEEILSNSWYVLKKFTFELRDRDGVWETQVREAYDRGNGATILLYNRAKGTVILVRQFRLPTYVNGNETGLLIEACAGLLDGQSPEATIVKESEEETGYKVSNIQKIGEAYMSPGSVTEIVHFYVAEYSSDMRVSEGGGLRDEQEHIEVLEYSFEESVCMVSDGRIKDAKTIMLIQYAQIHHLFDVKSS
jgi:GDP-mannose pyrophosphatase NudK